jgi:predicted DNA-binding transcriptional regulator YafY
MPAYSPAQRLDQLRSLLSSGAYTRAELEEKLIASESTIRRLLAALERAGEPLREEPDEDGRKRWSLPAKTRQVTVRMSSAQLVSLIVARNMARAVLHGTGFDDDLDDVCKHLVEALKGKDAALVKDLDRKLHDRGEMAWVLEHHGDTLDAMVSALLRSERVMVRRMASDGKERTHLFEPYTLVTHDKGIYFVGFSHDRGQKITLGLDLVREATWQRGDAFEYPADHDPSAMFASAIGMFTGQATRIVLRFVKEHVRYVDRRRLHPSQRTVKTRPDGSIEVAFDVVSSPELENLILSYGDRCEVLSPPVLRKAIGAAARKMAALYADA